MRAHRVWGVVICLGVAALCPAVAMAQSVNIDLGHGGDAGTTGRLFQLTALITILSLAPSLLVMVTAFTRIAIVLSLLRSAIGAQGTPPNTVVIGLALFLTFFVMQPTLQQSWDRGVTPLMQGQIGEMDGLRASAEPFRTFMASNTRAADLNAFLSMAHLPQPKNAVDTPWRALIPAFMVGELRRGFEMGFLVYLPFLIIDLVVSSVLMSLGMMMLPPTTISLPFKLLFFVLIDGWQLVAGSLVRSFGG